MKSLESNSSVRWNLETARSLVKRWQSEQWRQSVDRQLASIDNPIASPDQAMENFSKLLRVDDRVSGLVSARTLLLISGEAVDFSEAEVMWLDQVADALSESCRRIASALLVTPDVLSSNLAAWCRNIQQEGLPVSVRQPAMALNERWRAGHLSMGEVLLLRNQLDPKGLILKQRIMENKLRRDGDVFPPEFQAES